MLKGVVIDNWLKDRVDFLRRESYALILFRVNPCLLKMTKPWWKEALSIALGGILAIIGGVLTAWFTFKLQHDASTFKAEIERQSVLAGFQGEVEINLIKLKNRFDRYEVSIERKSPLTITLNEFSTSVYQANLPRVGDISDLGVITELVAFYNGLTALEDWASSLRLEKSDENDKRRYVSQLANLLHAGIYLQARMASSLSYLPRVLPTPNFDDDKTQLLERIRKLRIALGANPPKQPLRFNPSSPENRNEKD
jgi:hypothetical protein